jgi:uncharacterized protein DUF2752
MQIDPAIPEQVTDSLAAHTSQPSKRLAVLTLVGLSAVFLASVLLKPSSGDYFTICGFKNFTGLPCPGCGLTHSFCALGSGHMMDAFGFNLLGPPLFLVFVLVWIRSASVLVNRSNLAQGLDRMASRFNVVRAMAIAFAVYGVIRIIYLIAYGPLQFHDSPLSQLIARLIR